jgi:large repetitive protein
LFPKTQLFLEIFPLPDEVTAMFRHREEPVSPVGKVDLPSKSPQGQNDRVKGRGVVRRVGSSSARLIAAMVLVATSGAFLRGGQASSSPIPAGPTSRSFAIGAYIVDMGQTTQTVANGLKPYGLVYDLAMNKKIPVSWAFSDSKPKDGVDFTVGVKSYSGSAFIVPATFAVEALPTINAWKAKGVVVDGPISTSFTAPIYGDITSFPKIVLDTAKGSLATPYYVKAEIPSTAYRLGDPSSLTTCDDMYVMPHADPAWSTHNNLLAFNKRGGFIWAGCHSVSVLEGLDDPADADTNPDMNFLTTGGLIPFKSHAAGTPPYTYSFPSDPNEQFIGSIDAAQQNGSEQIYIPSKSSAWRPTTKVLTYDATPAPSDVANSGDKAATLIVGPGFGNPNNGYVMYEGGHSLDGTAPTNIASIRAFLDFHLLAGIRAALDVSSTVPVSIDSASSVPATASAAGGSGTYTYQWTSSCGGSFASATAATTTFHAPSVVANTACNLKVIVTDGCGRVNFDFKSVIIAAAQKADVAVTNSIDNSAPAIGDTVTYAIKATNLIGPAGASGVVVNNVLPAGLTFGSAIPTAGIYTPSTGVWTVGNLAFGATETLQLLATVNAGTGGSTLIDTASITSTSTDPSASNNTASVPLTVDRRPVANPDAAVTPESTPVTLALLQNDSAGDGLSSVSANTNPGHGTVSIVSTTGVATYTPAVGFHGTDTFTYTVKDADGDLSTATVTITVTDTADAPIALDDAKTTPEDIPFVIALLSNDTDADGNLDPTSVSLLGAPTNGTVIIDHSNGSATYKPNLNFNGTDTFTYQVCDLTTPPLCDSALVSIVITPVNDPIVAKNDSAATPEETPIVIAVLANDSDVEGIDPSSITIATPPAHGSVVVAPDHSTLYTPNLNFSGIDTFTYRVCDSSLPVSCANATVTVTVSPVADAPQATPDSHTTPEATPIIIDVLANDLAGDNPLSPASVKLLTAPKNGTVTIEPTQGKLTYTPNPGFHGTNTVDYSVCDTGTPSLCSSTVATISVTPVNDPIVARADSAATNEDVSVTIDLAGNDSDPDGNVDLPWLTITVPAAHGSVIVHNDGTASYTPNPESNGNDSFTYSLCDTGTPVYCDTAVVSVSVAPVNDAPIAAPDSKSTPEDTTVTFDPVANDADPEGHLDVGSLQVTNPPSHGSVTVHADGTVTYAPTSNFHGTDTFTYQICDSGVPAPSMCSVAIDTVIVTSVNDAPVAQPETVGTPKGNAITIAVLDNDSDVDANINPAAVSIVAAPATGATAINGDGTMSYTPTALFTGTVNFTYKMCDTGSPVKCDTAIVTVVVAPLNYPPAAKSDLVAVAEDHAESIAILANDLDADLNIDPSSVTLLAGPLHGVTSINATTGVATYTPAANFHGSDSFTYQVCDQGSPIYCSIAVASMSIEPVNDAPVPTADVASTPEDTAVVVAVLENDGDVDANLDRSALSITSAPAHGASTVNLDSTTTYVPAAGFHGSDTYAYSICDTGQPVYCETATVNITVTSINDAPTAVNDSETTPEDLAVNVVVVANDTDSDGLIDPATVTILRVPANGSVKPSTTSGTLIYTPNTNFHGTDTFTYSVCDDGTPVLCTTTEVTIVVQAVNDSPTPADDSAVGLEDTTIHVALLANDHDVDANLDAASVLVATPPANGTVTVDPTIGVALYTPKANFNGTDTFTYTVCDTGAPVFCNNANVTILVASAPDAPEAVDEAKTTPEDTPVAINVIGNDLSVDGTLDPTSVLVVRQPTNGKLAIDPISGAVTYSPNANYSGTDTFTYEVCTAGAPVLCDTADVVIAIDPVNDSPTLTDDAGATPEDMPVAIDVAHNDTDIDNPLDPTTLRSVISPANGIVIAQPSGTFRYVPFANFAGSDQFTYGLCDTATPAACSTAVVRITVSGLPDAPVAFDDAARTPEAVAVTVDVLANDTDPDANIDPAALTITSPPTHGSLAVDPILHALTFTPTPNYNGPDSASYQVCDSGIPVLCATANVRFTIDPVNKAPLATDDSATTPEDQPILVSVLVNDSDPDVNLDASSVSIVTAPVSGTATVNTDGTINYAPKLNFFGSETITYKVCDLGAPIYCDTADLVVAVTPENDAPLAFDDVITTPESTPVDLGVIANDTDIEGPVDPTSINLTVGTIHGQTLVDALTGTVSYTPNLDFNGTDQFTYEVCDLGTPVLCATAIARITITAVNVAPAPKNDSAVTGEDTPVSIDALLNDTDSDGNLDSPSLRITAQPAHGGAGVNPDHSITYSPALNYNGVDTFTYTICDTGIPVYCNPADVTIDIAPINDAPIAVDDSFSTPEDTPTEQVIVGNDTDIDNAIDPASVQVTQRPLHGGLVVRVDGSVFYEPTTNYVGIDSFTYQVCDLGNPALCATAVVNINVTPVNDPPIATDDSSNAPAETALNIAALTNDADIDENLDSASVTITEPPAHGAATANGDGTLTYTAATGFLGTDLITYNVCDTGLPIYCRSAIVTVAVSTTNLPPVAVNDSLSVKGGEATTVAVLSNDRDPNDNMVPATLSIETAPVNGTAKVNPDATITYIADTNYVGADLVVYRICDAGKPTYCARAFLEITVTETAIPPLAHNDMATTSAGTPVTLDLLANDSAPQVPLAPSTVKVVSKPSQGSVEIDSTTGKATYRPNPNFSGTDTFTYEVCDTATKKPRCTTAAATVVVIGFNARPTAVADSEKTPMATPVTVDLLTNDQDSDGVLVVSTLAIVTRPEHGDSVITANGHAIYTPNAAFSGVDVFTYQICDNGTPALCDLAKVTITVLSTNAPVIALADEAHTPTGKPVTVRVLLNDGDTDGILDPLTVTVLSQPVNGEATVVAGGSVLYTPRAGFVGVDTLIYRVCNRDVAVQCGETTATITVVSPIAQLVLRGDTAVTSPSKKTMIAVLANDEGPIDPQTLRISAEPLHGSAVVDPPGVITFQPAIGFVGVDQFDYQVCTSTDSAECAAMTVKVEMPFDPKVKDTAGFTGYLYEDDNEDGIRQSTERGLVGQRVILFAQGTAENGPAKLSAGGIQPAVQTLRLGFYMVQAASAPESLRFETLTDAEGRFAFDGLPPGKYKVVMPRVADDLNALKKTAQIVDLKAGHHEQNVSVLGYHVQSVLALAFTGINALSLALAGFGLLLSGSIAVAVVGARGRKRRLNAVARRLNSNSDR